MHMPAQMMGGEGVLWAIGHRNYCPLKNLHIFTRMTITPYEWKAGTQINIEIEFHIENRSCHKLISCFMSSCLKFNMMHLRKNLSWALLKSSCLFYTVKMFWAVIYFFDDFSSSIPYIFIVFRFAFILKKKCFVCRKKRYHSQWKGTYLFNKQ